MTPNTQDVEPSIASGSDQQPLLLQVIAGLHSGAWAPLAAGETLLIGSGEDCDVILSDPGVAKQHCVVARNGARIAVRALDAVVTVGEEARIEPGQLLWVTPETGVKLGDATFEIAATPGAHARANSTGRGSGPRARRRIGPVSRYYWGIAGVAVIACAASPLTHYVGAHSLQGDTGSAKINAPAPVRSGAAVAHDVGEVLRLSGFVCEVQYTGPGTVTVRGHLGDPKALAAVIESRAIREIDGLQRVLAIDLDQPAAEPVAEQPSGERLVAVTSGKDPYVITADGSRYYLGAQLPEGGRLAGLFNGDVLIERDGHIQHLKLPDSVKEPHISRNSPLRTR
jgi:hypothetical protein